MTSRVASDLSLDMVAFDVRLNDSQMRLLHRALVAFAASGACVGDDFEAVSELADMSDLDGRLPPEVLPILNGWCL